MYICIEWKNNFNQHVYIQNLQIGIKIKEIRRTSLPTIALVSKRLQTDVSMFALGGYTSS